MKYCRGCKQQKPANETYFYKRKHNACKNGLRGSCKVCEILRSMEYTRNRYRTDVYYRLVVNMRARVWAAFNGINKSDRTMELIGLPTGEDLHKWLYAVSPRFANIHYKELNVDHIIPIALYDLSVPCPFLSLSLLYGLNVVSTALLMPIGENY